MNKNITIKIEGSITLYKAKQIIIGEKNFTGKVGLMYEKNKMIDENGKMNIFAYISQDEFFNNYKNNNNKSMVDNIQTYEVSENEHIYLLGKVSDFGDISNKIIKENIIKNIKNSENDDAEYVFTEENIQLTGNERFTLIADFGIELDDSLMTDDQVKILIADKASELDIEENELLERLDYLNAIGCNSNIIFDVFKSMKVYDDVTSLLIPEKPVLPYVDTRNVARFAVGGINIGSNIYLNGPYGTGKNVLAKTLAWVYRRPIYEFSINSALSNNQLLGSQTLDENGKVKFVPSVIIEAAEKGGILVLDELNMGRQDIFSFLHSLLDGRRTINVPQYKNVISNDNFVVIATGNDNYAGTVKLNEALASRFLTLNLLHYDNIIDLLPVVLSNEDAKIFQQLYSSIVSGINNGEFEPETLSIRAFSTASLLIVNQKMDTKLVLENVILNTIESEVDKEIVQGYIENITNC